MDLTNVYLSTTRHRQYSKTPVFTFFSPLYTIHTYPLLLLLSPFFPLLPTLISISI